MGIDTTGRQGHFQSWKSDVPEAQRIACRNFNEKEKQGDSRSTKKIALTDLFYVIDKQGDGNIEEWLAEFLENGVHLLCTFNAEV